MKSTLSSWSISALMTSLASIASTVTYPAQVSGHVPFSIVSQLIPHDEDLHEARAIVLGRLGKHTQALETYIYRLQDFAKAEEYVHLSM